MSRKLNNVSEVRKVVDEYKTDTKPTLAGLMRLLGVRHYSTLANYIKGDNEIGDLLKDAYLHLVECHEKRLWDKGSATSSIFYLKTIRQLGLRFRDFDDESKETKPANIRFEIVSKDDKNES